MMDELKRWKERTAGVWLMEVIYWGRLSLAITSPDLTELRTSILPADSAPPRAQ